jgi:hypothetical protein
LFFNVFFLMKVEGEGEGEGERERERERGEKRIKK